MDGFTQLDEPSAMISQAAIFAIIIGSAVTFVFCLVNYFRVTKPAEDGGLG
jgi:hypothetical protein